MRLKYRVMALVTLLAALGAGCLEDEAAKEISVLRKQGDELAARGMAVNLLEADDDRMAIWCELAFTDEALCRNRSVSKDDKLHYLQEAGLICAAMAANNQGNPPDDRWGAVTTLITSDLNSRLAGLLGSVEMQQVEDYWESEQVRDELKEQFPESWQLIYPKRYNAWTQPDLQQVQNALRYYSRLKPLVLRLPAPSTQKTATVLDAAFELNKWADRRELSQSVVEGLYESGEAVIATAYAHAVQDLLEEGHLQASTILDSTLYRQ